MTMSQQKLIPSVIGDMGVRQKDFSEDAVTYSGSKYRAIGSAKYSGSSVDHHLQDMKCIRSLDISNDSFKNGTS